MPLTVTCPTCLQSGRVPDDSQGRSVKCPKCGGRFNAIGNPPAKDNVADVPPPLPPAEWLYTRSGQQHGPVSFMVLKGMAESGHLAHTDMVWKKGTPEWVTASSVGIFHGIIVPPKLPKTAGETQKVQGRNGGVAAVLSFLIPGLGQMYKGEIFYGFFWMILVTIGYVCLIVPGVILHIMCVVFASRENG